MKKTSPEMAMAAAAAAAERLRATLAQGDGANLLLATGASQRDMLAALATSPAIDWHRITAFHLDEYIGLPLTHPASFRLFLWRNFIQRLPLPLRAMHYIETDGDPPAECHRLAGLIADHPIDLALIGIGENGHLAFNDPPADWETRAPFLIVSLDEACRRQQVGEGWFATLAEVPRTAITMSIHQIMQSRSIIVTVPDLRKAQAVRQAIEGPVTATVPASILQQHEDVLLYLDQAAGSQLAMT